MPYRLPVSLCSRCDDDAHLRCDACQAALCLTHAAWLSDRRCTDCQHAFQKSLARIQQWKWRALGVALALPAFPLIVGPLQGGWRDRMWVWGALPTTFAMFDALLMTAMLGVALGQLFIAWRRRHAERRFSPT